jgi:hypothetical protein
VREAVGRAFHQPPGHWESLREIASRHPFDLEKKLFGPTIANEDPMDRRRGLAW